jgi:hypothetical protein
LSHYLDENIEKDKDNYENFKKAEEENLMKDSEVQPHNVEVGEIKDQSNPNSTEEKPADSGEPANN